MCDIAESCHPLITLHPFLVGDATHAASESSCTCGFNYSHLEAARGVVLEGQQDRSLCRGVWVMQVLLLSTQKRIDCKCQVL